MASQPTKKPRFRIRVKQSCSREPNAHPKRQYRDPLARCFLGLQVSPSLAPLHALAKSFLPLLSEVSRSSELTSGLSPAIAELYQPSGADPALTHMLQAGRSSQHRRAVYAQHHQSILSARDQGRSTLAKEFLDAPAPVTVQNVKPMRSIPVERPSQGIDVAPIYTLVSNKGERQLNWREYCELLVSCHKNHLFIDMTSATNAGRVRAGRRIGDGQFEERSLTYNEAAVLVELVVSKGRVVHPSNLKSLKFLSASRRVKIIEKAWREVDEKLSRYQWRSFHTHRGETPASKRFQFKPPDGVCYVVILPLDHSKSFGLA